MRGQIKYYEIDELFSVFCFVVTVSERLQVTTVLIDSLQWVNNYNGGYEK